jgi:tol-pal system protein YbgF
MWRCGEVYVLALAATFVIEGEAALAQRMPPGDGVAGQLLAQASPPKQTRPQAAPGPKAADGAAEASRGGEAQLRQRVEQLEEQLVDIQVLVGTLESLARNVGSATPSMRSAPALSVDSAADSARIDALETQVKALTAQLEQLSEQIRARDARVQASAPPPAAPAAREAPAPPPRMGAPAVAPPPAGGFGATIVTPGANDQIGRVIEEEAGSGGSGQSALLPPAAEGNPKQAYEIAYGYLLQQNYGAAESAFEDFLRRYPNDPLAGNAQYWLGESLFVRGQFKAAASAFLKGYQTYGKSAKAPDSLLKLAMSLDRLGQKDAACSSYAELSARFPNAPAHVKTRAQTERQRVGC